MNVALILIDCISIGWTMTNCLNKGVVKFGKLYGELYKKEGFQREDNFSCFILMKIGRLENDDENDNLKTIAT